MTDQNSSPDDKGAAVKIPPPFIFILLALCGYGLENILPTTLGAAPELRFAGVVLIVISLALILVAAAQFKKHATALEPWRPTSQIITTGPYAYSRNPIYVCFCLFNVGLGLGVNSLWILLSFIPAAVLLRYLVIAKEEAYLETKFGSEYLTYKGRVRRWL